MMRLDRVVIHPLSSPEARFRSATVEFTIGNAYFSYRMPVANMGDDVQPYIQDLSRSIGKQIAERLFQNYTALDLLGGKPRRGNGLSAGTP